MASNVLPTGAALTERFLLQGDQVLASTVLMVEV